MYGDGYQNGIDDDDDFEYVHNSVTTSADYNDHVQEHKYGHKCYQDHDSNSNYYDCDQ